MTAPDPPTFSPRAVLGLVLFGAAAFVVLLWLIGTGMTGGNTNDGGGHVGGRGLNGYAALAGYLDQRGFDTAMGRSEGSLDEPGLLVLTPPHDADSETLARIVDRRRSTGPTLVILPKWIAVPASLQGSAQPREGWVVLAGAHPPDWPGFQDDITVALAPMRAGGQVAGWRAAGLSGALPASEQVLSGQGPYLVPLVEGSDGRMLAGWVRDGGIYPGLEAASLRPPAPHGEDTTLFPLVFVFEPDLIDNYGMADRANAVLAERIVRAALAGSGTSRVTFDLTLHGFSRSANLLTLAFTPPYLAATLCLLLAALAVGWRAFLRFGPPLARGRAIAFGKRALVENTAGLILRAGRLRLIGPPYAAQARDRIARALGLPHADPVATDAAIDRALAARDPQAPAFSTVAARLAAARRLADMLRAARDLHSLERTLCR